MNFKKINLLCYILLLALSCLCLAGNLLHHSGYPHSAPVRVRFVGSYKVGDGEWIPIDEKTHIPACSGEITLKGHPEIDLPEGTAPASHSSNQDVSLFLDHINCEIIHKGSSLGIFRAESRTSNAKSCGKVWKTYPLLQFGSEEIEILLNNPHRFGNKRAVDHFLDRMYVIPDENPEVFPSASDRFVHNFGFVVLVVSVVLIVIFLFSNVIHLPYAKLMLLIGLNDFFAGVYFMTNSSVFRLQGLHVSLTTTGLVLSIMLYVFFVYALIFSSLTTNQRFSQILLLLSCLSTGILLIPSFFPGVVLFDSLFLWSMLQTGFSCLFLIVCLHNYRYTESKNHKILLISYILQLIALIADIFATHSGLWQGGVCSSIVFSLLFVNALILFLRVLPRSFRASIREKEMETELEKSRTAIMLSQIQPHFLYNSLSTIRELCRQDPEEARDALSTFISYLRSNMESLQKEHSVHFSQELEHISAYLRLEKLRFGNDLNLVYDIQETDFFIPSLTIQPLVENAVKHGICSREDGGTVTLHTHRDGSSIIITVNDDGIGFDISQISGKENIGLSNVRTRLTHMAGGTLEIQSIPGTGTTVTVTITDQTR